MSSVVKNLVSVVIPCYNHEPYIQECILSVIGQLYQNIELLIIDDGSSDGSAQKIKELIPVCKERFVRFEFRVRPNKGLCATLNEAIEWCEGEFFSAIASDDLMYKDKSTIQVAYLNENLSSAGVFGGAKILRSDGTVAFERPCANKHYSFKDILFNSFNFFTPTQMLRMEIVRQVGCYKAGILLEDWYLYLKISHAGYSLNSLQGTLVGYRRHEGNMSNKVYLMHADRKKILDEYKGNILYKKALLEFDYTRARELVYFNKMESFNVFFGVVVKKPGVMLKLETWKYIAKFFCRKSFLERRVKGF